MIDYYERNQEVDIVIGQIGRGVQGDWKIIPTHEEINRESLVSLAEAPEILQSIGPGGKLFNSKFSALRFDEDVVFCEEHTFVTRAYLTARDINYYHSLYMAIMSKKVQSQINELIHLYLILKMLDEYVSASWKCYF